MRRLFQVLVVCGAGLGIVQCGGRSKSDGDELDLGRGGMGSGSGGAPAAGGEAGSGGSSESGGESDAGASTAGATPMGSAGEGKYAKPDGPTEQWVCNTERSYCLETPGARGVDLDSIFCAIELERPASEADCGPGTQLACLTGFLGDEQVRFNCECLSAPPAEEPSQCSCPEPRMPSPCLDFSPPTHCEDFSLCGCSFCMLL